MRLLGAYSPVVIAGPPGPAFGRPEDKPDPAIHRRVARSNGLRDWMPGSSPGMTVSGYSG